MPSKNIDVAKPDSTPADTTSKPVIVGHRPMVTDPMVNEEKSKNEKRSTVPMASTGKKITPISAEFFSKEEPKSDNQVAGSSADDKPKTSPAESSTSSESLDSSESKNDDMDDQKAELKNQDEVIEDERQVKLKELIISKKYNVELTSSKKSSVKSFFLTVTAVLLLGALVVLLLDDAGVIDLGVQLPFDFIK